MNFHARTCPLSENTQHFPRYFPFVENVGFDVDAALSLVQSCELGLIKIFAVWEYFDLVVLCDL